MRRIGRRLLDILAVCALVACVDIVLNSSTLFVIPGVQQSSANVQKSVDNSMNLRKTTNMNDSSKSKYIKHNNPSETDYKHWCKDLNQNFTREKRHFYWGQPKKFVTMASLLQNTNCVLCKDVCENLLQRERGGIPDTTEEDGGNWRSKILKQMSIIVKNQLDHLQKPSDCSSVKKVFCKLRGNKRGFCSHLHDVAYCLLVAFVTKRTLVLNTERFRYGKTAWEDTLSPISTCSSVNITEPTYAPTMEDILSSKAETITICERTRWVYPTPDLFFLAIPEDLAFALTVLNEDPPSWWISQFVEYTFKVRPALESIFQTEKRSTFAETTAGLHIRRTDKVSDFQNLLRGVDEYMSPVIGFFDRQNHSSELPRRVFVATDDTTALEELEEKYPSYTFIYNEAIAASADGRANTMFGITHDLYLLSQCDFVVATFSSNVGLALYELLQARGLNVTDRFKSLDRMYLFSDRHQTKHVYEAMTNISQSSRYFHMSTGDILERSYGNLIDGAYFGRNCETGEEGHFPAEKVKRVWPLTLHPSFKDLI